MAKEPLFTSVSPEVLKRPTYKAFISLLDNYKSCTGQAEVVTPEEIKENLTFIDAIMGTTVMKKAHEYLASKGKVAPDERHFKQQLYDLWFKLYRRTKDSKNFDSSGFEHVFVGETRGGTEVIGFHNWIQFYLQEKAGNVDYQGYILGSKVTPHSDGAHECFTSRIYLLCCFYLKLRNYAPPTLDSIQLDEYWVLKWEVNVRQAPEQSKQRGGGGYLLEINVITFLMTPLILKS